jgi:hypothetical protein
VTSANGRLIEPPFLRYKPGFGGLFRRLKTANAPELRNGSGQAHSIVKIPVRKEASTSIRLLILYGVPKVNI